MKFLFMKILTLLLLYGMQSEAIHKKIIMKITILGQIHQTTKILVLKNLRLYGIIPGNNFENNRWRKKELLERIIRKRILLPYR